MMRFQDARGFSLSEMLVALAVFLLAMSSVTGVLVHNARLNKSEQLTAEVQANARNCLALVVERLRTAGWDPANLGIPTVVLDPDPADDISLIVVLADFNGDGAFVGADETVLIRHLNETIEWQTSIGGVFVPLAANISNDADGDGTVEPMVVPDTAPDPSSIAVQITARSPVPDPISREFIRYTVRSEVTLRSRL